jgi:hypothetical protein
MLHFPEGGKGCQRCGAARVCFLFGEAWYTVIRTVRPAPFLSSIVALRSVMKVVYAFVVLYGTNLCCAQDVTPVTVYCNDTSVLTYVPPD